MGKKWFVVYTTSQFECSYCNNVKALLNIYGFDFYEKDIHKSPHYKEEFLEQGFRKVPQVYFEDTLIGGYDNTKDWVRNKFFENFDATKKNKIKEELDSLDA